MVPPGNRLSFLVQRENRTLLIIGVLTLILCLAAALRLWGMELRGTEIRSPSPAEIYMPGAPYLALRLTGVVFALGSIPLVFAIARKSFGSTVGGLAALMLALHGFHISWSQTASPYVVGGFLSLLATWLLLRLTKTRNPRPGLEICYIASVIAGVLVIDLFWPLFMTHIFWAMLVLPRPASDPGQNSDQTGFWTAPRLLQIQTIAFILSAPALIHGLYRVPQGIAPIPSADLLAEYFSFGSLFAGRAVSDAAFHLNPVWNPVWAGLLLVTALVFLRGALKAPKREAPLVIPRKSIPRWIPVMAALASGGCMFWLASMSHPRGDATMALSALPFTGLMIPALATLWRRYVPRLPSKSLHHLQEKTILIWLLAVVVPLVLFVLPYKGPVLSAGTFMIFSPYYLMLCAAGVVHIFRARRLRWITMGLTLLVFATSIPYGTGKAGTGPDDRISLQDPSLPARCLHINGWQSVVMRLITMTDIRAQRPLCQWRAVTFAL